MATKCVSDTVELGHEFFFNVPLCFAHKPLISTLSFFTCFDKQGQGKPLATFGSLAQEVLFFPRTQRAPGQDLWYMEFKHKPPSAVV